MWVYAGYRILLGFFQNRTICLRYFEKKHGWNIRQCQIMGQGYRRPYYLSNSNAGLFRPINTDCFYNGGRWDNIWTKNGQTMLQSRRLLYVLSPFQLPPRSLMYQNVILSNQIENPCFSLSWTISYFSFHLKFLRTLIIFRGRWKDLFVVNIPLSV